MQPSSKKADAVFFSCLKTHLLSTSFLHSLLSPSADVTYKGGPYSEGAYRRSAHLPFIGCWARRWINHCCLWRMASATSRYLPSLCCSGTHCAYPRRDGQAELTRVTDSLPARRRSLTGPSVE